MLIYAIGGGLAAILLAILGLRGASRSADLGSMSQRWVDSHNASRH